MKNEWYEGVGPAAFESRAKIDALPIIGKAMPISMTWIMYGGVFHVLPTLHMPSATTPNLVSKNARACPALPSCHPSFLPYAGRTMSVADPTFWSDEESDDDRPQAQEVPVKGKDKDKEGEEEVGGQKARKDGRRFGRRLGDRGIDR